MKFKKYFLVPIIILFFLLTAGGSFAQNNTVSSFINSIQQSEGPADLIVNIYLFALGICGTLAVGMVVYGGVKYVVSSGSASSRSEALDIIRSSIFGIILLAGAYVILNTINPQLLNLNNPILNPPPISASPGTGTATTTPGVATDQSARDLLTQNGIGFRNHCPEGSYSNCVNFDGIRSSTLNALILFKNSCVLSKGSCSIYVTGGTEGGHSDGTYSHANGYKVDIRLDANVSSFIQENPERFQNIGQRGDGALQYRDVNSGDIYALEGDHWDITYR